MTKRIILFIFFLLLTVKFVFAQSTALHLQITDQNSSLIPNVSVKLKSNNKIVKEITKENPQEIIVSKIEQGKYVLEVQSVGFKTYSQEIEIIAGKNDLTVKLELADVVEKVEVDQSAQEKSVDEAFSGFLTKAQIEALSDDPKEMEKELREIAGDSSAVIKVDGFLGGNLPQKSQIASIRIVRSSFDAENHELGFTYINITTKPGNQKFSGSLSSNFNDESLNARNAFSSKRFPEQSKNTIFFLSGPIKKDKTAFSTTIVDFRNFNSNNINASLPSGSFNDSVNSRTNFTTINTTINQNLTKYHNAKFDYEFVNSSAKNLGVGGFDLAERAFDTKSRSHQLRVSESGYISNKFLNEIRFELKNETANTFPQNENVGIIVLDSFSRGGAGNFSRNSKLSFMFADNLLFGYKNHALKIGLQTEHERLNETSETNKNGTFLFSSLADFNLSKPAIFTQNVTNKKVNLSQFQLGFFIQDDWRVKKNLSFSFGLRYEVQNNLKDYNNFSPRLGFTWSPLKTGKLTFRGGGGIFYNWLETSSLSVILSNDISQSGETIIINPSFPNPFLSGTSQTLSGSYWQTDVNLKNPYIVHASFATESRLSKKLNLRANYVYQKGVHQFRSRNINAPILGVRPNSNFGNITNIESSAFFVRNTLNIGLNGSLRKNISFYFNYDLAKTVSDNNGIFGLPSDNYNLKLDRSFANNDQRHRFSTSWTWTIRKGLRLSGNYSMGSPLPFTITTGKDNNNDTIFNDRPFGIKRNSQRGTWRKQLDLSFSYAFSFIKKKNKDDGKSFGMVTSSGESATGFDFTDSDKRFSLKFYATAENLLNQTNLNDFAGVQTSPFFLKPTSSNQARKIVFGLRFNF
jgi:outer membrane receptor protein involved in Fe transport